jgi:GNAT superfamily N-acetyltransferase
MLRPARQDDMRVLTDMLVEAANWNPERARPRIAVLAEPTVAHYVTGWRRPGDFGTVAEDDTGTAIGACWFRLFTTTDPGYGFIAPGVPELTLGVAAHWRSQGIGRALLRAAIDQARQAGYARVSLSCERANFAMHLYRSEGFVPFETGKDSDTLVRILN